MILYHGSAKRIEHPFPDGGNAFNDFGDGFYCTQHRLLAGEWACSSVRGGFINEYSFNTDGLHILNLQDGKYTILNWLALLVVNRNLRLRTPLSVRGAQWLRDYHLIDISAADLIIGYRADDSYFAFARAFLNNEISLSQLSEAMHLGQLGEQYVIKTQTAYDQLTFTGAERADGSAYYPKRISRDRRAREDFDLIRKRDDLNGIYLIDLMRSMN